MCLHPFGNGFHGEDAFYRNIVYPSGKIKYFRVLLMSFKEGGGDSNTLVGASTSLVLAEGRQAVDVAAP